MTTWSDVWRLIDVWHQKCSRPPLQRRDQLRSTRFQLITRTAQRLGNTVLRYALHEPLEPGMQRVSWTERVERRSRSVMKCVVKCRSDTQKYSEWGIWGFLSGFMISFMIFRCINSINLWKTRHVESCRVMPHVLAATPLVFYSLLREGSGGKFQSGSENWF